MILTKEEVIKELEKITILEKGQIIFKVIDYRQNHLAPEKVAYQLHYTDSHGKRHRVVYYPNTFGFQWG